jgi:hypothetical protein
MIGIHQDEPHSGIHAKQSLINSDLGNLVNCGDPGQVRRFFTPPIPTKNDGSDLPPKKNKKRNQP